MKRFIAFGVLLVCLGCSEQSSKSTPNSQDTIIEPQSGILEVIRPEKESGLRSDEISQLSAKIDDKLKYKEIAWTDLMPEEDVQALMNPPSYITEAEEGSLEDQISSGLKNTLESEIDDPYQRALRSKNVVAKYDGMSVKLAGFVVPLEFDDEHVITEFFLVPFFGACIHVPPPPPNQIIYVKYPKGFKIDALYNPIWVYGVLTASLIENDVATSVYSLDMAKHKPYKVAH